MGAVDFVVEWYCGCGPVRRNVYFEKHTKLTKVASRFQGAPSNIYYCTHVTVIHKGYLERFQVRSS